MYNNQLSASTIEKLKYYVYLLIDPRDNTVFYVWKGKWNRINSHLLWAEKEIKISDKYNLIRAIKEEWLQVIEKILRHWLNQEEALAVESAIIDLLWIDKLTNIVKWHYSDDFWLMDLSDIKIKYEAEQLIPKQKILLININNRYHYDATQSELYNYTRKSWRIDISKAKDIDIVCAVYRGIIREVFFVERWLRSEEEWRYMFEWYIASDDIRNYYLHKSVTEYWKQWAQNPIKYINLQ